MTVSVGYNRTVKITRAGVTRDLSDNTPYTVLDVSPLGASLARRITERSPGQHGDTDIAYILDPREMTLVLQAVIDATWPYYTIRADINRLFRASDTTIYLDIEFDNGDVYRIATQSKGQIDLPFNIQSTAYMRFAIRLRAANPTFYDPNAIAVNFALSGGSSPFVVPTPVPTFYGATTLDQTHVITYDGTFADYPIITIYGPITNPVITHLGTNNKIDFTGITIASGDYYTIDLRYGRKLVYRNGSTSDNRISEVTADSQLATFAILPDPDVAGGLNAIRVTGTTITAATNVYLQYYRRFDGI